MEYTITTSKDFFIYSILSKSLFFEIRKHKFLTEKIVFKVCEHVNIKTTRRGMNINPAQLYFIRNIEKINENILIKNLDISNCNYLVHRTYGKFNYLKELRALTMCNTEYIIHLEDVFYHLDNLEKLYISKWIINDCAFRDLKKLKYLNIAHSEITREVFEYLKGLEVLCIDDCQNIYDHDFVHLTKLKN